MKDKFQFVGVAGITYEVDRSPAFLLLGILRASEKTKKRAGSAESSAEPALKCFLRSFESPIYSEDVSEP